MYDLNYQEVSSSVREKQALSEISMNEFAFKEQLKLNSYIQRTEAKQWITAQENELQRSHFHSIALNSDGSIIEIESSSVPNSTKNLICRIQGSLSYATTEMTRIKFISSMLRSTITRFLFS